MENSERDRYFRMILHLLFCLVCIASVDTRATSQASVSPTSNTRTIKFCRDRFGVFPEAVFRIHTCSECLDYLIRDVKQEFHVNNSYGFAVLQTSSNGQIVLPDPENQTTLDIVCSILDTEDCRDWKQCCQSASECCKRQPKSLVPSSNGDSDWCPMTWDGFSCVDRTLAGQTAAIQCPAYIRRFTTDINGEATRQCWSNSTWFTNSLGLEWTDYSSCHKVQDHQTILTLKLVFKGISLALLVPSITIFIMFRPLRSQLRIKLHINLFLSLALTAVFTLLWEVIVSQDLLHADQSQVFVKQHQVACKFLNMTSQCLLTTTFFWMFCEGFYLTWLMLRSFRHLSSMVLFNVFGWGVPVLFSGIYIVVRVTAHDDNQCWVSSVGNLQWIMDGPIVACIAMNLIFLVMIMRVMMCQLRSQHEDQCTARRSLRALLILIPLFGLQQFCTLYRPKPSAPGFAVYEVVNAAINNLQGAVVALIFCFFNGEVRGHLKDLYRRLLHKLRGHRQQSRQSISMASSMQTRPSRASLASIDTSASVILAPTHLASHSSFSSGEGDGDGRTSGFRMIRNSGIDELDQEPDSGMTSTDIAMKTASAALDSECSVFSNGDSRNSDGYPAEDAKIPEDSCQGLRELSHSRKLNCWPTEVKKRFMLLSKVLGEGRNAAGHFLDTGRGSKPSPYSGGGVCNPTIVISQVEGSASNCTPSISGGTTMFSPLASNSLPHMTDANSRMAVSDEQVSLASVDDGASSRDSYCGDDSETLQLVGLGACNAHLPHQHKAKHQHLHRDALHHPYCSHGKKHGHPMTSSEDDTRPLYDADSLQGSDSAISLASVVPNEADIKGSNTTENGDSGTSGPPVRQDMTSQQDARFDHFENKCFVNVAFEDN